MSRSTKKGPYVQPKLLDVANDEEVHLGLVRDVLPDVAEVLRRKQTWGRHGISFRQRAGVLSRRAAYWYEFSL